jgi:hypothetical protein
MVLIGKEHASKAIRKAVGAAWNFEVIRSFLNNRYVGRNNGMIRMNCGNIIRAMRNRQQG